MKVSICYAVGNPAPVIIYALHERCKQTFVNNQFKELVAQVVYDIPQHIADDVGFITTETWETLIIYFDENQVMQHKVMPLMDHLEEKLAGTFKFYSPNQIKEGEKHGIN